MTEARTKESIDRYFAGTLDREATRAMFLAIEAEPKSRAYFEARQAFAALDPSGLSETARVGHALGLRPARRTRRLFLALPAFGALCAVAILAIAPERESFVARGAEAQGTVSAYISGARPSPLGARLRASDELMFAYQASEPGYLAIFAVDGAGEVYWYWPAWTNPEDSPRALRVAPSDRPIELREAVRQDLRAGPLRVFAAFFSEPLSTREIEQRLPSSPLGVEELLFAERTLTWRVDVD